MTNPVPAGAPTKLKIVFATVSGTARQVAEAISMQAADIPNLEVELVDMHDADPASTFGPTGSLLLMCVATTGSGDVPDDGQALYRDLVANPRYLGGLRYGLIALGDSSYGASFCGGGLHFENVLQDLGAERLGEILQLDAMEEPEPENAAMRWFAEWKKRTGLTR